MRPSRSLVFVSALTSTAAAQTAFAFGGTARELERQGNFVVTNDAGFGTGFGAGFSGSHQFNDPEFTTFQLRPALNYFVIPNLSLGGAVELDINAPQHGSTTTTIGLAPEIGFEIALSDTWSIWPSLSLPMAFPINGNASLGVSIFVPFLVHPAEHYFFGIGPGFAQGLTSPNPITAIYGSFLIGGYFDH
jgi:long-subunit fatty acid transport protein